MSRQIVELPVERLRLGVYVARLDRPWVETPFLFQGFEVSSDEEIAELRRLCKVVFVEVTEADEATPKRRVGATAGGQPQAKEETQTTRITETHVSLDELSENVSTRRLYVRSKDPVPLRTELVQVKAAYGSAKRAVAHVIDELRRGRRLDVPHLETVVDSMVESVFRNREAVSWLARMKSKDEYVYSHSLAASVWALVFGRHLGLDKETLKAVGLGAMLLDVGKTQIATELLTKPGKLTEEEIAEVRRHVEHGLDVVRSTAKVDEHVVTMISTHHERFDGSGYPFGLKSDAIPMIGRIAAMVDCYDAMTSVRSYARAKSTYDAVREFKQLSNRWFQAELVELFIQAVGVFPTGTLVELNTGEVGVIVGQNTFRRLRPEVMLLLDAQKKLRDEFVIVDLQAHEESTKSGPSLWIARGLEPGAFGVDPTEYFL